jgi:protein gp37
MRDPFNEKSSAIIFVGSMSDIEYWEPSWIHQIIEVCENLQRHTFMFLSKESISYCGYCFPKNCLLGLTIEHNTTKSNDAKLNFHTRDKSQRTFLSIEPLLGHVYYHPSFKKVEKIIVGCDSNKGAQPPCKEWIQDIKDNCPADKLFWKSNIKRYL